MSNIDIDVDTGPSVRDHLLPAYAAGTASPDVDRIVGDRMEDRTREVRNRPERDRHLNEGERSDRLRSTIKGAVREEALKAVRGPAPAKGAVEVSPVPVGWDKGAQAAFHDLPEQAKLAALRQESDFTKYVQHDLKPHLEEYGKIHEMLKPHQAAMQAAGVKTTSEGVGALLSWHARLSNPQTRQQAYADLGRQFGIALSDYSLQQQHYADPQAMAAVNQDLARFSSDKPHFERVRVRMGLEIQAHGQKYLKADGGVNLDKAYVDACRLEGIGQPAPRRAVSSAPMQRLDNKRGTSVRDSVLQAVRQSR